MEQPPNISLPEVHRPIHITLLSAMSGERIPFTVPASMRVKAFVHSILNTLAEGENRERIETMRRYYEPVLELLDADGAEREVLPGETLAEAGFCDGSECRLAARPIKSEQLFCRHCV